MCEPLDLPSEKVSMIATALSLILLSAFGFTLFSFFIPIISGNLIQSQLTDCSRERAKRERGRPPFPHSILRGWHEPVLPAGTPVPGKEPSRPSIASNGLSLTGLSSVGRLSVGRPDPRAYTPECPCLDALIQGMLPRVYTPCVACSDRTVVASWNTRRMMPGLSTGYGANSSVDHKARSSLI